MDPMKRAQRLAAAQFGDAPRELALTVDLALAALKEDSLGEALNELNRADALVETHALTEWEAEVMATWAVYYFQAGEEQRDIVKCCGSPVPGWRPRIN